MLTIAIPSYMQEKVIAETIESALSQRAVEKEILVIDDDSTDRTRVIVRKYPVRLIHNPRNIGIGNMLTSLMYHAKGQYIVYLCGDDVFTTPYICHDIFNIFSIHKDVGVIDRNYFQFLDGTKEKLLSINEKNILQSACQPSGMAFRKDYYMPCNKIFIEMPSLVKQALHKWKSYKMNQYTIGARIHPGGNTATVSSYYGDQSPTENWVSLIGTSFRFPQGFIQLKNRCPKLLMREIWITMKLTPMAMLDIRFWLCAFIAIVTPRWLLIKLSFWYRVNISRLITKWRTP